MNRRYIPRRVTLKAGQAHDKPPKLRFRPGTFVKEKGKKGQLYCIRVAFREKSNPREWLFYLEERQTIDPPNEPVANLLVAEAKIDKATLDACPILWEPLYSSMDVHSHELCRNMYHYGSSKVATNKELLNHYEVVDTKS